MSIWVIEGKQKHTTDWLVQRGFGPYLGPCEAEEDAPTDDNWEFHVVEYARKEDSPK